MHWTPNMRYILLRDRACIWPAAVENPIHQWKFWYCLSVEITCFLSLPYDSLKRTLISIRYQHWKCRFQSWECRIILSYIKRGMSIRPSGDTAGGFVFDDVVDKQVVHVSATSFRSGAERVSMYAYSPSQACLNVLYFKAQSHCPKFA